MRILLLLIFGTLCLSIQAQKTKVLNKPLKFERPISYKQGDGKNDYELLKGERGDEPWIVISDRDNNKTYVDRSEKSSVKKVLSFGTAYRVIDEKDEWLKIGSQVDPNEYVDKKGKISVSDFGWIKKDKLLLWNNSLSDPITKIHLKGFLLNKAKNFNSKELKKVYYYSSPDLKDTSPKGELDLYNFYFIYKIEYHEGAGNDRYLLGVDSKYNPYLSPDNLKGWVDQRRIDEWNTRLAITPNFEDDAFAERKSNSNLRVRGFDTYRQCKQLAEIDNTITKNLLWDSDPTILTDKTLLSRTDPKRYNKNIIRFPILKFEPNSYYYRSGVIATHGDGNISIQRAEIVDDIMKKEENINVFFLLDGSSAAVGKYKSQLKALFENIQNRYSKKSLKIGLGIYKDNKNEKLAFRYKPLGSTFKECMSLLNSENFTSYADQDFYNLVGYGLQKSLIRAGFNPDATNIIIQIGDEPDIKDSEPRRKDLKMFGAKKVDLRRLINQYSVNWLVVDAKFSDDVESDEFQEYIRTKINDFVKAIFAEADQLAREALSDNLAKPIVPELSSGNEIAVTGFHCELALLKPNGYGNLPFTEIQSFIEKYLELIDQKVKKQTTAAMKFKKEGISKSPSSGEFTSEIIPILLKSLGKEQRKILTPSEQRALLTQIAGEQFYSEVFLPTRIKGLESNPYSFVLFMPQEDLLSYKIQMQKIADALSGTEDQNRRMLKNLMFELAYQLSGETALTKVGAMTIDDISELLQGIAKEGYDIERKYNIKLKDIENRKAFPTSKLREFSQSIAKKFTTINSILLNNDYEYKYTSDNVYYWIPLKSVF